MEHHAKKPGSVRLTDMQYQEMKKLGITNESAYVKYKLDKANTTLTLVKEHQDMQGVSPSQVPIPAVLEDRLTIQRLALENQKLTEKLEEQHSRNENALNGVNQQVHSLLQEELRKRDFDTLTKEHTQQQKEIEKLEGKLDKAEKETESKQEEIEALVKKLGFIELGKTLLPSAISGLAKQYPKQMKGIAGTLGQLGLAETQTTEKNDEEQQLLDIMLFLKEMFTPQQFEEALQLIMEIGERIPQEQTLLKKVAYYLQQISKPPNPQRENDHLKEENN